MFRLARRAPVTTCSWLLLVAVYLGTHGLAGDSATRLSQLRRTWGSVESLNWVIIDGGRMEVVDPELHGPFDLWDGQWWRVPLSVIHHVNLLHLLLNASFVVMFGPLLEQRWGAWRYGLFLGSSAMVSMPWELLLGLYGMGYSGVCCAIFGALLALRPRDPELQVRLPDESVAWMLAGLVGMVLLTWADILQIGNLAHFTGLAYGWVAGIATGVRARRIAIAACHVLLIVPYWFLVHPVWLGRYQWYLADMAQRSQRSREIDIDRMQRAVALDPRLARAWRILADDALRNGDVLLAWERLLRGLEHNPSDEAQWQAARKLWRRLVATSHQPDAMKMVQDRFGNAADRWLLELRRTIPPPVLIAPHRPPEPTHVVAEAPPPQPEWEPPPAKGWSLRWRPPSDPPELNPFDPHSAVEGETL